MGLLRSPDGTIVNLPDDQVGGAVASGYEPLSLGQAAQSTTEAPKVDNGIVGDIGAGASSFLSGATLGASDVALKYLLPDQGYKQLSADREDHPWISSAGNIAGTIAPALLSGGTFTPAGYLSSVTAQAAEDGAINGLFAAGVEGSIQNAGAYIADAALGDRDTTAQGMVGALGTGFAFGTGGALAAHGVERGTIAARRMFSRVMDGGEQVAKDAAQAWKTSNKEVLDAHDQAVEIAKAKLSNASRARDEAMAAQAAADQAAGAARSRLGNARRVRDEAGIARDTASAGIAEAKIGSPAADAEQAQAAARDNLLGRVDDQAARADAFDAAQPADVPSGLADFARQSASPPPPTAAEVEDLHDLASKVDNYTAARRDFDQMVDRVENPDLESSLGHLPDVDVTGGNPGGTGIRSLDESMQALHDRLSGVPVGEFGEPGKGGIKSQDELAHLASERWDSEPPIATPESVDATRAGRPGMAKGTPVGPAPAESAIAPAPAVANLESRWEAIPINDLRAEAEAASDAAQAAKDAGASNYQELKGRAATASNILDRRSSLEHGEGLIHNSDDLSKLETKAWEQLVGQGHHFLVDTPELNASRYANLSRAKRQRLALEKAVKGDPGAVMAISDTGAGVDRAIKLVKSGDGTKYTSGDGGQWKVADSGNKHSVLYSHIENRLTRALGGVAPETLIGYVDGIAHRFERVEPSASVSRQPIAKTNPLIRAWAQDAVSIRAEGTPTSGPGPAVMKVLADVSENEAKRYIAELSSSYDSNTAALNDIIDESGLSDEVKDRIRASARTQISWLLSAGGGVIALTAGAGAAVARGSGGQVGQDRSYTTSYEAKRLGRPTDGRFEVTGSDGSREVVSKSDMHHWVDSHLPPGFSTGAVINPATPFSIKTGIPSAATADRNALYVVRPSELAERGIMGNELHPDNVASVSSARTDGKRLPPLTVDVTPEGRLYLDDGNHRLDIAARGDEPVAVQFRPVSEDTGWKPQERARDISERIKERLPSGSSIEPETAALGKLADEGGGIRDVRPQFEGAADLTKPGVTRDEFRLPDPEPETELEKLLRGTKEQLDAGKPISQIGSESPARHEFVANKAADRARQASEFRDAANRRNFGISPMGTAERVAQSEAERIAPMRTRRGIPSPEAHPLAVKQLELAHDEALERAATAQDPAIRSAAAREAKDIERQLTQVGARPGAVEDVAAMAGVTTRMERAAADMVEKLGPDAPPAAQKAAADFRSAEEAADRKTMARTARAADDHAEAQASGTVTPVRATRSQMNHPEVVTDPVTGNKHLVHPETGEISPPLDEGYSPGLPLTSEDRIAAARADRLRADADLALARADEGRAKITAREAEAVARDARSAAKQSTKAEIAAAKDSAAADKAREKAIKAAEDKAAKGGTSAVTDAHGGSLLSRAINVAKVAGAAGELDIPGIPSVHDIPVIGPILGAYIKYRTLKAAAGRFVGRVPASADSRAAALAAKTKDAIAHAVDRSLGLVERNQKSIRTVLVASSTRVGDALKRRLFDDGLPDAPKGASVPEVTAVRIREVAAAVTSPQLVTQMVRKQMRDVVDPDLITAVENHLNAMFKHLNDTAPKGPPPNPYTMKPWVPSAAEALQWGRRVAVAHDPRVALDALETQSLTPEAADTLRACYDKLFTLAQQRMVERAADLRNPVPYRQRLQNSLLFDVALDSSLQPENAAILSSAHATSPGPGPGAAPGGPPPGAPPAPPVPSIANPATNVSSLYQTFAANHPGSR